MGFFLFTFTWCWFLILFVIWIRNILSDIIIRNNYSVAILYLSIFLTHLELFWKIWCWTSSYHSSIFKMVSTTDFDSKLFKIIFWKHLCCYIPYRLYLRFFIVFVIAFFHKFLQLFPRQFSSFQNSKTVAEWTPLT